MTDNIRKVIRDMTGHHVPVCPWRAFKLPIVQDVMHAMQFFESGHLEYALPDPSHRLVAGIGLWHSLYSRMMSRQLEIDRKERESAPANAPRRRHG